MNNDGVRQEIRTLETLRAQARLWRLGASLAVVVITLVSTWMLVNDVWGLFKPGPAQEEFTSALSTDVQRDVLPGVQSIAGKALTDSKPAIEASFSKLNDRVPDLANASMAQLTQLQHNLPQQGNQILMSTFGDVLKKEDGKIRTMFPDVTEQNVTSLIDNISTQAQGQFATVGDSVFSPHVKALNAIMQDLNKIETTEPVNPQEDKADWEMALLVVDDFHTDLQNLEGAPATGKVMKEAKK